MLHGVFRAAYLNFLAAQIHRAGFFRVCTENRPHGFRAARANQTGNA